MFPHPREDVGVPRLPRQPCHGPHQHRPRLDQLCAIMSLDVQFPCEPLATVFRSQLPRELLSVAFRSQLPGELHSAPPWPGLPRESQPFEVHLPLEMSLLLHLQLGLWFELHLPLEILHLPHETHLQFVSHLPRDMQSLLGSCICCSLGRSTLTLHVVVITITLTTWASFRVLHSTRRRQNACGSKLIC